MASARPSKFKRGGGGFLNNVDATIIDYQFTEEFNGVPFKPGKWTDGRVKVAPLYAQLAVRVDGAEEDSTTNLRVGNAEDFDVSDDGHTLTSAEDMSINGASQFGVLITSMITAGLDETEFSDDELNFEPIIGKRVRFVQQVDVEKTERFGKQLNKKTGAQYDRKNLIVTEVYSDAVAAKPAKAASKVVAKKTGKPAVVSFDDLANETLLEILGETSGPLAKAKISMKVLKKLLGRPAAEREGVRELLNDDAFLANVEGVEYNVKKQLLELAA